MKSISSVFAPSLAGSHLPSTGHNAGLVGKESEATSTGMEKPYMRASVAGPGGRAGDDGSTQIVRKPDVWATFLVCSDLSSLEQVESFQELTAYSSTTLLCFWLKRQLVGQELV